MYLAAPTIPASDSKVPVASSDLSQAEASDRPAARPGLTPSGTEASSVFLPGSTERLSAAGSGRPNRGTSDAPEILPPCELLLVTGCVKTLLLKALDRLITVD